MTTGSGRWESTYEIPLDWCDATDPFKKETLYDGQFDWGGGLLRSNGGAQR